MSPTRFAALLCLPAVLAGCSFHSTEDFTDHFSVSLDGGPALNGSLPWSCSVRSNHSPVNFGPTYFMDAGGRYTRTFATFPDGRIVLLVPRGFPIDSKRHKCLPKPLSDWEGYVLDTRSEPGRLYHVASGKAGAGLPALSVQPRRAATGEVARDMEKYNATWRAFEAKLKRITLLTLEEARYFGKDGLPLPERADDAAYLLSLPKGRPSVLLPGRIADEPLPSGGSMEDADWHYKGLAQDLRFRDRLWGSLLPSADGAPVAFDLGAVEAAAAQMPSDDFGTYLLGDFPAPLIRIPGVERPVRVAPSVAVWYPDRKRLIRIIWSDATKEMREAMSIP